MKIICIIAIILLLQTNILAQNKARIISLKNNSKQILVQTWTTQSDIIFQINNFQWIQGRIIQIKDTFFTIRYFKVEYTTYKGIDTIWYDYADYAFNEIIAFPLKKNTLNIFNSGILAKSIGIMYSTVNSINALSRGKFTNQDWQALGIGASFYLIGKIQSILKEKKYSIGKKYSIIVY